MSSSRSPSLTGCWILLVICFSLPCMGQEYKKFNTTCYVCNYTSARFDFPDFDFIDNEGPYSHDPGCAHGYFNKTGNGVKIVQCDETECGCYKQFTQVLGVNTTIRGCCDDKEMSDVAGQCYYSESSSTEKWAWCFCGKYNDPKYLCNSATRRSFKGFPAVGLSLIAAFYCS